MFSKVLILCVTLSVAVDVMGGNTGSFLFPENGRYILPTSLGPGVLDQCSRNTPQGISEFWNPSVKEIERLEELLVPYLEERRKKKAFTPPQQFTYHRQYIGFVRNKTRFIYGNFYPLERPHDMEKTVPFVVCDGGPSKWGIIFDPKSGTFEEPEFNGEA